MSSTGTPTPAAAATSIGAEIAADGEAFIQSAEADLTTVMEAAWVWVKNELAALEPAVLADLKTAVATAATEAIATGSTGSVVTDTLNILARDGTAVLTQVKSDVVTAVVGLTTATPAKS
jgi:hypothetical protein